jgi:Concanavalin A-like lectin/glucanases superfamily
VKQSGSLDISSVTGNVASSENINIGQLAGWMMSGSIDDVRVYNRVLSAAEIAALYNSGK